MPHLGKDIRRPPMTDELEYGFIYTSNVFMSTLNSIILVIYSPLVLMQI